MVTVAQMACLKEERLQPLAPTHRLVAGRRSGHLGATGSRFRMPVPWCTLVEAGFEPYSLNVKPSHIMKERVEQIAGSARARIERAIRERVDVVDYDPCWPEVFRREKERLRAVLPSDLVGRIEHFGSTAVPGLAAKPIVDMLVEVRCLEQTKTRVVPLLAPPEYEYFWRPTFGDDGPPWYAWFIKRSAGGLRTHHLHLVEPHFEHWQRLRFRDYLIAHPETAARYGQLKRELARRFPDDRVAFTRAKGELISDMMRAVKATLDE
jgi:GrpB-like predicted nucleotidyltransferase (UPF0157 family)